MNEKNSTCKNCNNAFEGKYCNECGQSAHTERFNFANIAEEFIHGFYHLHSGIFYTFKELSLRPGITIKSYLEGKRINYFNPFTYLLLISFAAGFFHVQAGLTEHADANILTSPEVAYFISKHYSLRMILSIPIYSLLSYLLFRSAKLNFPEHLVLNTFIVSHMTLIAIFWMIVVSFFHLDNSTYSIFLTLGYASIITFNVISFASIFKENKIHLRYYLKAVIVVVSGILLTYVVMDLIVRLIH